MELQLEMINDLRQRYEDAVRREKREMLMSEACKKLNSKSLLKFLEHAYRHLDEIGKAYEYDE